MWQLNMFYMGVFGACVCVCVFVCVIEVDSNAAGFVT